MNSKVKNVNEYTRELKIDYSWDEVKSDFNRNLKNFSKKIKIPGFRSGKIPKDRLLQQFKPNLEADFVDNYLNKYYLIALKELDLKPVNQAEINDLKFYMESELSFSAKFEIEPINKLPRFKSNMIDVQKTHYVHDSKDIDDAIIQLKRSHARIETIDSGAEEGDFVVCSLQKLDESGLPIIGKKYDKQYLKVGAGSFTDDQKEKLIGIKPNEKIILTLPVNKNGEKAQYEVVVDSVDREVLPELDNKFIKMINPDLASIDALKNDVEEKIKSNFEERSKQSFEQELIDKVIQKVDPIFAPSMVENYLDNIVKDIKDQNKARDNEVSDDEIRNQYRKTAEKNIKWYSIRKLIIDQENISADNNNINSEIDNLVKKSPDSEKEIRKFYKNPSNRKKIEDSIIENKILDYLKQFIKVKVVEVETKELRNEGKDHE
mgnify:CR=1 FL=1